MGNGVLDFLPVPANMGTRALSLRPDNHPQGVEP